MTTTTIILAAGASVRMGSPKALLPLPGRLTFVEQIAQTAREAGTEVVCVLGPPHGETIRPTLPSWVRGVWNERPELGMLSSVKAGLATLRSNGARALIWPVDMPYVSVATIHALLAAARENIIVPTYNGHGGHPLSIPSRFFDDVFALPLDGGLRALLQARASDVARIAVDDPKILVDVDTPADFAVA